MKKGKILIFLILFSFNSYSQTLDDVLTDIADENNIVKVDENNEDNTAKVDESSKNSESNTVKIDENNLKLLIKNDNPSIESINSLIQQNVLNEKTFNRDYDFKLSGSAKYLKSSDNWSRYDFTGTNNETSFGVGLEKKSVYGMSGSLSLNDSDGNYFTFTQPNYDLNRSGLSVNYSIDLWKNFLGYQTLTNKLNLELNTKQSKVKGYIEKNSFYYSLRRLYWQLVIKNKELEFYGDMIKQAEQNLKAVQKRYKNYIADDGDLAKAKANVDLRKVNYDNVKVEIENYLKQFKYYLPNLGNKNIAVDSFDLTDIFGDIMVCNKTIYDNGKNFYSWKELTTYNEYIELMDKIIDNELKIASREDDVDITLDIGANFRGLESKFSDSFDDLSNFDRNDYSISLNVNKTIGGNNIEEDKMKLLKMNYNVNKNNTIANITSIYTTYENIMKSMFNNLNNLHKYRINMEKTVKNSEYKYNQGRISLTDLINDQNSLIDANIQLINMEGVIIDTILQYLSIFDKTQCNFNLKF